jgi:hypothetical protein
VRGQAASRFSAAEVERPLVARRPVFTPDLAVGAYELLTAVPVEAIYEERLAGLVISAVADVGLPTLVGNRQAVIPISRDFVERGFPRLLPAGKVIFAVSDALAADPGIAAQLRQLSGSGYRVLVEQPASLDALSVAQIAAFDAGSEPDKATAAVAAAAAATADGTKRRRARAGRSLLPIGVHLVHRLLPGPATPVRGRPGRRAPHLPPAADRGATEPCLRPGHAG